MLLMFGVGLHFSLDDLLAVRRIALPGAVAADRRGDRARHGRRRRSGAGALGAGHGVRAGAVGGEHGGAAAGAGGARRARVGQRPHRRRLARGRGPGDGAGAGAAAAARRLARRQPAPTARRRRACWSTLAITLAQGRRVRRADAGRRPARLSLAAVAGGAHRLARAVHAVRRRRGGRHRLRLGRSCSACRSRSAPSSPAWCCASRSSATAPPRSRCRCATPSRCCSSSRSACCSTRSVLVDEPLQVLAVVAIIMSASRWPRSRWCSPSAIRSTPR